MGQKKSKNSASSALDQAVIRRITAATCFLPDEIQYFYYDFLKYTPTGYLTLADFEKFYQTLFRNGRPDNFAKYVFDAYDTNQDEIVDFEEFITGLYYTTKATPAEKIQWAFQLCDRDGDEELTLEEIECVIQALYELSDADMTRIETYDEAIERIKQLLFTDGDEDSTVIINDSITRNEFISIVRSDKAIIKLIDCQSPRNKTRNKSESSANPFKKQLKFRRPLSKSLSDSKLAPAE